MFMCVKVRVDCYAEERDQQGATPAVLSLSLFTSAFFLGINIELLYK